MKKFILTLVIIALLLTGLVTFYPPSRAPTGQALQVSGKAIKTLGAAVEQLGNRLLAPEGNLTQQPQMPWQKRME